MIDFKELALGIEALDHVKYVLKHGKTLSSCILKCCNIDSGKVTTYLPVDVSEEEAKKFKYGGKVRISPEHNAPIHSTTEYLVKVIQTFLNNGDNNLCIFEDATSIPSDPRISLKDTRILIFNNEVYYVLFKKDAKSKEKIDNTIWDSDSHWHFVCVMTSIAREIVFFRNNINISKINLKSLAKRTEKIAIGSYDGEGYLIWNKD